jgi:hypothetical protein
LDIIRKNNELDIELYKFAEERFKELIKQQGFSFEEELKVFKLQNDIWQDQQAIIRQKNRQINYLQQKLTEKDQLINDYHNNLRWRMTTIFRNVGMLFRRS